MVAATLMILVRGVTSIFGQVLVQLEVPSAEYADFDHQHRLVAASMSVAHGIRRLAVVGAGQMGKSQAA